MLLRRRLPFSLELTGRTARLVMASSPMVMLVRACLLLRQVSRRLVNVSLPASPLLPLVSSTGSCKQFGGVIV